MSSSWRELRAVLLVCAIGIDMASCGPAPRLPSPEAPQPTAAAPQTSFIATAYTGHHRTASGIQPHKGVVAADPGVLPLGSRIRVRNAGEYSGHYVVRDTGRKVRGRKIDIYMPRYNQAKRFGRRHVKVEVLEYGPLRRQVSAPRHQGSRHHRRHRKHRHHHPPRPARSS